MVNIVHGSDPDGGNSEFSIQLEDNSTEPQPLLLLLLMRLMLALLVGEWLKPGGADKNGFAVFGEVAGGWGVVDQIVELPVKDEGPSAILTPPVLINSARVQQVPKAFLDRH